MIGAFKGIKIRIKIERITHKRFIAPPPEHLYHRGKNRAQTYSYRKELTGLVSAVLMDW